MALLNGFSIGEKKRSLRNLLHGPNHIIEEDLHLNLSNHIDRLLLIDFLILKRNSQRLYSILQETKTQSQAKKILKQQWLLEEFAQKKMATLSDFLPHLSLATRFRFLKQLAPHLSENQADQAIDTVWNHYGISGGALHLITSCSSPKITTLLQNNTITLTVKQLQILYDKNAVSENYLWETDKPIFQYIASKNIELLQNHPITEQLSRSTTRKFLKLKHKQLMENPELYVKNLHPKVLISTLNRTDFAEIFLRMFPKRIVDFSKSQASRLFMHYPKKHQYELLTNTFNKVFQKKLQDSPNLIDDFILGMVNDPEQKQKLAVTKWGLEPETDKLKYFTTEKSIPLIKRKFKFARTPWDRSLLVGALTESCLQNNDYDALLDVSIYITTRLKNDYVTVQEKFLQILVGEKCDFSRITKEHWDQIRVVFARPDFQTIPEYTLMPLFFHYLEFLQKNSNDTIPDEITRFFKTRKFSIHYVHYISKKTTIERAFLCHLIKLAPNLSVGVDTRENLDCQLAVACLNYNKRFSNNTIDLFIRHDNLSNSLRHAVTNHVTIENNALAILFEALICATPRVGGAEALLPLYWSNFKTLATPTGIKWFITNQPHEVTTNIIQFIEFALTTNQINVWNWLHAYTDPAHIPQIQALLLAKIDSATPIKPLANALNHFVDTTELWHSDVTTNRRSNIIRKTIELTTNLSSILSLALLKNEYRITCTRALCATVYKTSEAEAELVRANHDPALLNHAYLLVFNQSRAREELHTASVGKIFRYLIKNPEPAIWDLYKQQLVNAPRYLKLFIGKTKQVPLRYRVGHVAALLSIIQGDQKLCTQLLAQLDMKTIERLDMERLLEMDCFGNEALGEIVAKRLVYSGDSQSLGAFFAVLAGRKEEFLSSDGRKRLSVLIGHVCNILSSLNEDKHAFVSSFESGFSAIFSPTEAFREYVQIVLLKYNKLDQAAVGVSQLLSYCLDQYGDSVVTLLSKCLKSNDFLKDYHFFNALLNENPLQNAVLVIKLFPLDSEPEDRESYGFYKRTLNKLCEISSDSVKIHLNLYFKLHKVHYNYDYFSKTGRFGLMTGSWITPGTFRQKRFGCEEEMGTLHKQL